MSSKKLGLPLLKINVSWLCAGKFLAKYLPYLLTIIGIYINANKFYNIVCKKRYRHPKNFYVRVGHEITPSVIFPIKFVKEEKIEGDLILKYFKKNKKISVEFDYDDELKLKEVIREIISSEMSEKDKEKITLYFQDEDSGQKRVYQYVRNGLILNQLDGPEKINKKII